MLNIYNNFSNSYNTTFKKNPQRTVHYFIKAKGSKITENSKKPFIDKLLDYLLNNPFFKILDKICGVGR